MTSGTVETGRSLKAGLLYFVGVFAVGFALGALRLMLLQPTLGELLAVIIELPIILLFCWVLARRAIERLQIPARAQSRIVMGSTALLLLWVAEFFLATIAFSETPVEFFSGLTTAAGLLGLGGQIVFGLMPLLQLHVYKDTETRP